MSEDKATVTSENIPSLIEVLRQRHATHSLPLQRTDPWKLSLTIEGGGMRGTMSAGMVMALQQVQGLYLFDDVYGTSIGAVNGMYLINNQTEHGLDVYEKAAASKMIDTRRFSKMLDVDILFDEIVTQYAPVNWEQITAHPVRLHPMVMHPSWHDAKDGARVMNCRDVDELQTIMRAAVRIPGMGGWPVGRNRHQLWDAGFNEAIPWLTAQQQGATHQLMLRTMPDVLQVTGFGNIDKWQQQLLTVSSLLSSKVLEDMGFIPYATQAEAADNACDYHIRAVYPMEVYAGTITTDIQKLQASFEHGYQQMMEWWQRNMR